MVGKLFILGLLAAIAWFGYDYYSKNKDDIDRKLSGEEQPQTPGNPDDLIPPPPSTRPGGSNPPKPPAKPGGLSTNPGTGTRPNPAIPSPHTPVPPRPPVAEPQLPPGDPELQQKAVALILDARKKRDAQLSRNSKEFTRLLDRKAATAAPSDAEVYEQIRKDCANGWVPEPDNMPELTTELSRAYNNAHNEQQKIDSRYQTELTRIRDFYVPMLQKKAAETSDPEQKKRLIAQAERAFVLSKWISIVAPEPGR